MIVPKTGKTSVARATKRVLSGSAATMQLPWTTVTALIGSIKGALSHNKTAFNLKQEAEELRIEKHGQLEMRVER